MEIALVFEDDMTRANRWFIEVLHSIYPFISGSDFLQLGYAIANDYTRT